MKIEKLSECSVKITLTGADLSNCGIRYDCWDSEIAAGFLLSISDEIKAQTGKDITSEKLYVEIFSRLSGCMIFISFPGKLSARKSRKCRIACSFGDYASLKSFCYLLKEDFPDITASSSLYYSRCILRLEIEIPCAYKELIAGSDESGYVTDCDEISDAAVKEYYVCAEAENAAEKIIGRY